MKIKKYKVGIKQLNTGFVRFREMNLTPDLLKELERKIDKETNGYVIVRIELINAD